MKLLDDLHTKPESYWVKRGEKMALKLFHDMADRVPAYQDVLTKEKINPNSIQTIEDFKKIPTISKQNYLRQYSLDELSLDGKLSDKQSIISTTSGSTGDPFYFPRTEEQDLQYALTAELYLLQNFSIDKKTTLYIIGFPMGAWIGGVFTLEALLHLRRRGNYPLSIITPGINKLEIIKAVKTLGKYYDQIIIGSYGPFLKDTIDDGPANGVSWKDYNLGFIFSAEAFSESFRDYILEKTGTKNIYTSTLNHYGTVDLGTMSHETPLSILLRRKGLFNETTKLPTLTQYVPEMFYFENIDNNLVCSARSGLPLVRYDLKDHGGTFTLKHISKTFNVDEELKKEQILDTKWNLPFVYVYERSDFSVSFFAFQIYPETIRKALQQKQFEGKITGKFMMQVTFDKNANQQLEIHVELRPNITQNSALQNSILQACINYLMTESSEYRETQNKYPVQTIPKVLFWPYEDPTHFRPGTKQKWVK